MVELIVDKRQISQPSAPDISDLSMAIGNVGKAQAQAFSIGFDVTSNVLESANKIEADLHYTEATNLLNKELVSSLSKENIVSGNAYERYMQTAQDISERTLPFVNRKYKSIVKNQLDKEINKFGLQVARQEIAFKEEQNKTSGQIVIARKMSNLEEAIASGDIELTNSIQSSIDDSINDMVNIGAIDAYYAYQLKEKVKKSTITAEYSSKFEDLLRSSPIEADIFLKNLGEKKPVNLTHEEWSSVQATLLQQKNEYIHSYQASQRLGQDEYNLAFDSGLIKTPQDLDAFIQRQSEIGRYFSPNDKIKMYDDLVKANNKVDKEAQKLLEIDNAVIKDPDALYNFSTSDLEKYYIAKSGQIKEGLSGQKEANPDMAIPSDLTIEASVASTLPYNIAPFARKLGDKLQYGTVSDVEDAIKVGDHLLRVAPKTYSMLPKETQVYHNSMKALYSSTTLNIEQMRDYVNKSLAPRDSATQKIIDKQLADLHKTGFYKGLYKDIYGTKFVNPALQPQFNNLTTVFDVFYNISGDKNVATDLTKTYMNVNSGKSDFIPKYDVTKNPIEKTKLYIDHPIFVKNQIATAVNDIILNYEHAKDKGYTTPYTVEWPDGVKKPDDIYKINQQDFVEKPIMVNEKGKEVPIQLKINGKNRKIFLMNPNTDLEDQTRDQRQFYFEDDFGIPQPLYVSKEFTHSGGTIKTDSGIPAIQFKSINQITPDYYKNTLKKSYDDEAIKQLREEYKSLQKSERAEMADKIQEKLKDEPYDFSKRTRRSLKKQDKPNQIEIENKKESEYIEKNLKDKSNKIEKEEIEKPYNDKAIEYLRERFKEENPEKEEAIVKSIPSPGSYYYNKKPLKTEDEYNKRIKAEEDYIKKHLKSTVDKIKVGVNEKIEALNKVTK